MKQKFLKWMENGTRVLSMSGKWNKGSENEWKQGLVHDINLLFQNFSSSDESDSDSDSDIFEDPVGSPLGAQTLQLANDWIDRRYSNMQDSDDDFYEYSSEGNLTKKNLLKNLKLQKQSYHRWRCKRLSNGGRGTCSCKRNAKAGGST